MLIMSPVAVQPGCCRVASEALMQRQMASTAKRGRPLYAFRTLMHTRNASTVLISAVSRGCLQVYGSVRLQIGTLLRITVFQPVLAMLACVLYLVPTVRMKQ